MKDWWRRAKNSALGDMLLNPVAGAIVVFVVFLLLAFNKVYAQEFSLEAGPTVVTVDGGASFWLTGYWDSGPGDSLVATSIFIISDAKYKDTPTGSQAGFVVELHDRLGPVDLGIGVGYQQDDKIVVNGPFRFSLMLGVSGDNPGILPDFVRFRHLSNSGSTWPNRGWNMVHVGWWVLR